MKKKIKQEVYDPRQQNDILDDMFEDCFLEYASYVILERAVQAQEDGLKPVQRRLMHALKEMDDGHFKKASNVCMNWSGSFTQELGN